MAVNIPSVNARRALKALGVNLKTARLKRRISVKGFAERVGVSESTISRLEKGDDGVSIGALPMACLVLGENEGCPIPQRPRRLLRQLFAEIRSMLHRHFENDRSTQSTYRSR